MIDRVGINICPYCGGTDLIEENRSEQSSGDGEIVCQDIHCENCGRKWTVEYRPVQYFLYPNGEFDPTPHPIKEYNP